MQVLHIVRDVGDPHWWAAALAALEDAGVEGKVVVIEPSLAATGLAAGGWPVVPCPPALTPMGRAAFVASQCNGEALWHAHDPTSGVIARLARRGSERPLVLHRRHGILRGRLLWESRYARRGAALVIATSRAAASDAFVGDKTPTEAIRLIPDGVPDPGCAEQEAVAAVRRSIGVQPGAIVVLAFLEPGAKSGVGTLLRAIPHARNLIGRPLHLVLADDSTDHDPVLEPGEDLVHEIGIRSRLCTWLAAADIVVAPGHRSPPGRRMLQALPSQRPLVAVRAPELDEVIPHGVTAIRVEPRNSRILAFGLAAVACDDARASRLVAEGRRRYEEQLTMTRMASGWRETYLEAQQVSNGKRAAHGPRTVWPSTDT